MQVRRLKVFPIEAIVRGYISGSAWKEYTENGTIHGMMVSGPGERKLRESEKLENPIYTPCRLRADRLEQHERWAKIANV
jgi:phosphoribosylaminoimidazole-succinocarboxamide synthase